jgi:adenine/guanine phosphoribosyltransferase-like PRPP-binding protein
VPTRAGTLYPDLALVSDDGRALLEILTWATPEHVARVRAAAPRDVIVCVDRRGVRGAIAVADALVVFDRVIDADALLAAAERAIARPPPEGASA